MIVPNFMTETPRGEKLSLKKFIKQEKWFDVQWIIWFGDKEIWEEGGETPQAFEQLFTSDEYTVGEDKFIGWLESPQHEFMRANEVSKG